MLELKAQRPYVVGDSTLLYLRMRSLHTRILSFEFGYLVSSSGGSPLEDSSLGELFP